MGFGNMGTIWSELGLDSTKFNQGMKLAESRVALAGRKMQTIGRTLTMGVSLPLMAVGVAATKAGMDFDSSMTKSLAIMNNVSPQIRRQMEQTAKDVVNYTTFSAKEAADAYFFLASAGLDAAQSIEALPRVAKFAQAGNFDLALATDLLTDAQSALGLTIRDDVIANMENMTRVSDVLVKANTLSNATVQQFSESLTNKAGAAMKLLNIDIEEGVGVLAAWADQGVKGALSGNYLNIVLRDLQRAAIKGEEVFDEFGIRVFDASGNFRNMADIITDLEVALDGMSDKEKRATLMMLGFQDRSISAMMTLLGTSDAIRGYEKDLRSATGYTEDVATKQMESFTAQVEQLKNELILVGIEIFDILRPHLEDLIEQVKKGIDWFDGLSDGQKKLAVNIGLVAAALGPTLMIFGQLLVTIPKVTKAVVGLTAANRGLLGTVTSFTAIATGTVLMAEGLDRLTAGMDKYGGAVLRSIVYPHSEALHGIKLNIEVIKGLKDGTLEWVDVLKMSRFDLEDWAKEHRESAGAIEESTEAIEETTISLYEEKKALHEAAVSAKDLAKETEDTTGAIEDQEDAVDDLRQAYNELIDEIFGITNAENDLQESEWALEDATKAVKEATDEFGEGSREAEEKINDYDDALQDNLRTLGELYTEEGISIERKEELRLKYIDLLKQIQETTGLSNEAIIAMAEQFGLSSLEIRGMLYQIESGATGASGGVKTLREQIDRLKSKDVTITTTYKEYHKSYYSTIDVGKVGGALGGIVTPQGIQRFATGGLPHAQGGMITPNIPGGIPVIAHENELILDSRQQAKLLFEIAKGQNTGDGGTTRPIELINIVKLDGEVIYEKMQKIDNFNRDRIVE